ncbi:N-acetyltransferase [Burkholderia sp. AU18528]|uniref:GNAT family N-acetyltransferase n=1 Tax=Burkholderia TaxID=32008 RepID=UPI000755C286|nr:MULTISPECIES: GNAT family N-acetyltransferase [Burkholderia]KWH63435.1 GCN5 family acetyltransferase [Burkholderia anthina]MDN7700423.1 GNAT family N-acetyltransferase [Burkholderia sp. AU44665]PHP85203.1 N-acetyltransferase [Burkholderia sp. AU18528]
MNHEHEVKEHGATSALRYRRFTAADVPAAHALSMALRWPFRAEDWQFSAETSVAFAAEENGEVIGTAMCWKYGADRAAIGHVIVSDAHQGRGIGRKLMETLLDELGPRITFLHATPAGRPLYEKLGFTVCGSLGQYQGNVDRPAAVVVPDGERLRAGSPADWPRLVELATRASGLEREALLSALQKRGESVVLERDGEVVGFSVLRRFGRGDVIGPVVAPRSSDDARAKALIGYWLTKRDGEFVRIDVPDGSSLPDWLSEQGLKQVDTCSKMVRNAPAAAHEGAADPIYGLYGLVSQAML